MLEWTGALCIDKLGITCGSNSSIVIVFLGADDSINAAMIRSAIVSSLRLIDANDVKFYTGLPLFWCLLICTRDMTYFID